MRRASCLRLPLFVIKAASRNSETGASASQRVERRPEPPAAEADAGALLAEGHTHTLRQPNGLSKSPVAQGNLPGLREPTPFALEAALSDRGTIVNPAALVSAYQMFSQVPWSKVYEAAIGYHRDAAQQTAAHVVSDLNAATPADRPRWTPESLGRFFAAFADVRHRNDDDDSLVAPVLPPGEIVEYAMRGAKGSPGDLERLRQALTKQCEDMLVALKRVHMYELPDRSIANTADDGEANAIARHSGAFQRYVVGPASAVARTGGKVVGVTRTFVGSKRLSHLQQKVAASHADALRAGGLSTKECQDILRLHGFDEAVITRALTESQQRSDEE